MAMKTVVSGALLGLAAASESGTLKVTWSDCGGSASEAHVNSLTPDTITLGTPTQLTSKETFTTAVSAMNYKVTAVASGITLLTKTGNACAASTIALPLGVGSLGLDGFSCPVAAGAAEFDMNLSLSANLPAKLATVAISLTVTDSSGAEALCAKVNTAPAGQTYPTELEMEAMWERFKKEKGQSIDNEATRFAAFKFNVKQAVDFNAEQNITCKDLFDDPECVFGITKFSHQFQDEFEATHLGYKRSGELRDAPVIDLDALQHALEDAPSSVDWRKQGAVTKVKDQGDCGSCWAFSATEEIESAVFMATKTLPVLSTQQIISCDKSDDGCDGGDTVTAYQYVEKAKGIDSAQEYPDKSHTTGKTGKCNVKKAFDAKVTGFSYAVKPCNSGACKHQDEAGLATALANKGPISICVNAGGNGWQNYKKGIYSKKCSGASSQLDHCVQLVGYDKSGATPYWIVRNSWNTDWGIQGYMHLEMGKNLCGVADEATIAQATPEAGTINV